MTNGYRAIYDKNSDDTLPPIGGSSISKATSTVVNKDMAIKNAIFSAYANCKSVEAQLIEICQMLGYSTDFKDLLDKIQ